MSDKPEYTAETHRLAFETFYETKSYSKAMDKIGCHYSTILKWRGPDFKCPWRCPWHNWDQLERARDEATLVHHQLLAGGVIDPAAHVHAVSKKMKELPAAKQIAIHEVLRGDAIRLQHWEYLYGMVFAQITGQVIPQGVSQRAFEVQGQGDITYDSLYQRAMKVSSCEGGLRALQTIQAEIDKIVFRNRPQKPAEEDEGEEDHQSSIEELRQLKLLAQHPQVQQIVLETTAKKTSA